MKKGFSFIAIIFILGIICAVFIVCLINFLAENNKKENFIISQNIKNGKINYIELNEDLNEYTDVMQKNKKEDLTNKEINDNYYDVKINFENNKVIADEKEILLEDFFDNTSYKESYEEIKNQIEDNYVGEIEDENNVINIKNPYFSKKIIIQSNNFEQIEELGNATTVAKITDDIYCINYDSSKDTKDGFEKLSSNKYVSNICNDEKISILEDENLESLEINAENSAWGANSTGLNYYKKAINAKKDKSTINVAILDTGIYKEHEIFNQENGKIIYDYSYNFVDNNYDVSDKAENSHGTKVAGIIAQSTSENVKIVPIKVIDLKEGLFSNVLTGMSSIKDKVDIINISLGTSEISDGAKRIFDEMLKELNNSGIIVVCATGNDGKEDVYYPAISNYTIAVSAVGNNEDNDITQITELASYSNYGNEVDFSAPGSDLKLPAKTGISDYEYGSGTSFATPFVTAAIALLKSENPKLNLEQSIQMLKTYCYDLGEEGKDKYFGHGCIDFLDTMFKKPKIVAVNTETDSSENFKKITCTIICKNKIRQYGYSKEDNVEPTKWEETNTNYLEYVLTVPENEDYFVWVKDENENIVKEKVANSINEVTIVLESQIKAKNLSTKIENLGSYTAKDINGKDLNEESYIGTGTIIFTKNTTYTVIVKGDINGNGLIDINDIAQAQKVFLELNTVETIKETAIDMNNNKKTDINDIAQMQIEFLKNENV